MKDEAIRRVSEDGTRGIQRVEWGYACYRGKMIGDTFKGEHVGVVVDSVQAAKFLIDGNADIVQVPPTQVV